MGMRGPTTDHEQIRAWAESQDVVPVEALPGVVDHEPSRLKLIHKVDLGEGDQVKLLSWTEFFSRFELLGLSCVYDNDSTGYNELLQIEDQSPYRNSRYRVEKVSN